MTLRSAAIFAVGLLPAGAIKNLALRRLGWTIGRDVRFGPCLVVSVDQVSLGDGTIVGCFNVFRDLARLELGQCVRVGQWNWVTASSHMRAAGARGTFAMGRHTCLASRHYLDCTGGIRVGAFSSIAGERSTFLTHGLSWVTSEQTYDSIEIGDYCILSSNLNVAAGTVVGDRVVVAMGSTIAGELSEPGLYVQPRAELVKHELDGKYFDRLVGDIVGVRPRR